MSPSRADMTLSQWRLYSRSSFSATPGDPSGVLLFYGDAPKPSHRRRGTQERRRPRESRSPAAAASSATHSATAYLGTARAKKNPGTSGRGCNAFTAVVTGQAPAQGGKAG